MKKVLLQNLGLIVIAIAAIYYFTNKKYGDAPTESATITHQDTSTPDTSSKPSYASYSYSKPVDDAYYMMHVTFAGEPDEEQIEPLVNAVLKQHGREITHDNLLRVANMLFTLRKESALGVTEMEILKHMYQNYSYKRNLSEQAGYSAAYLELTK